MRKGRREFVWIGIGFLLGTAVAAARSEARQMGGGGADCVGLTVELRWQSRQVSGRAATLGGSELADPEIVLAVSEGQVAEVIAWPQAAGGPGGLAPRAGRDGQWILGRSSSGRVRARLEPTLSADVIVRQADLVVRIPVAAILERSQQTPSQAPLLVNVERLPWDSLLVDLGPEAEEGIVPPRAAVRVSVGYNIVAPEISEVAVKTTATLRPLRGGEVVWRQEQRDVLPANQPVPPTRVWTVATPREEGPYVLEYQVSWEPANLKEGSRLGRLIRRRRGPPAGGSASRRVILAVVEPQPSRAEEAGDAGQLRETEVDLVDLARIRNTRFSAWGRAPATSDPGSVWVVPPDLIAEASRKEREWDRLRSWVTRAAAEAAVLGPADGEGLAWAAVGLRVNQAGRPHRLAVSVVAGDPAALGVALIDRGGWGGEHPRIALDACATGPPILNDGPPAVFSWLVWPSSADCVLVLLNRNPSAPVRLGTIRLTQIERLPRASARRSHSTAARSLGLHLAGPNALDRFGGGEDPETGGGDLSAWNLAEYLGYCGATLAVLPEGLAERGRRRLLHGQASEDATGPDRLDLQLRLLHREGIAAWLQLNLDESRPLPGLPPPGSPEAARLGLVRIDRNGRVDGPAYHPLHPRVRDALKELVRSAATRGGSRPGLAGILIQLGAGPSLLGLPDTGLDDETFARFVKESFGPEVAADLPGLGTTDPQRFAVRARYLAGVGRMPWLTWRSRAIASLYAELSEAARAAAPGTVLALATPLPDGGVAGVEARRVDQAGLAPSQAWRSLGLELESWPTAPDAPIILRGVCLSTDATARDLATHPDLDSRVASRSRRGFLLTVSDPKALLPDSAAPDRHDRASVETTAEEVDQDSGELDLDRGNPAGGRLVVRAKPWEAERAVDEPFAHSLAALDAHWILLDAAAVAGREERVRHFARLLESLPAWAPALDSDGSRKEQGIVVRRFDNGLQTFLALANDTPYPIRVAGVLEGPAAATVEDLGRGLRLLPRSVAEGRQLVLDLPPFGVASIRIGAPRVRMTDITPYPSEAVLASMEARYREISNRLAFLARDSGAEGGGPPNPGFEPEKAELQRTDRADSGESPNPAIDSAAVGGWKLEGANATEATLAIDRADPFAGQGCLRLTASQPHAAAASEPFVPLSSSKLAIQAQFRADPGATRVRLWIEGESGGVPYVWQSEFVVGRAWEARAVQAADLPADGLERIRLRFELLTPGTLWVDEVKLIGDAVPSVVRLNARRTLLAALQAYREQRYAEFARLSSSHWARHPAILAAADSLRGDRSNTDQTTPADPAAATALPLDRRLR
jgi:hypothetical protein